MANCEICGKNTQLLKAIVSGTELDVCEACSKFGKVLKKPEADGMSGTPFERKYAKIPPKVNDEPAIEIVKDYASIIKSARENAKLSHEDLSKKIAERESLLHHVESGHHEPSVDLAKKLEKFFKIKLIEAQEEQKKDAAVFSSSNKASQGMTLGDFIKKK